MDGVDVPCHAAAEGLEGLAPEDDGEDGPRRVHAHHEEPEEEGVLGDVPGKACSTTRMTTAQGP